MVAAVEVGGAGQVREVDVLAQVAAGGVAQKRLEAREVQADPPRAGVGGRLGGAFAVVFFGGGGGGGLPGIGQAVDVVLVDQHQRPGLGGVEDVVGEAGGELRELLLQLVEAVLRGAGEAESR